MRANRIIPKVSVDMRKLDDLGEQLNSLIGEGISTKREVQRAESLYRRIKKVASTPEYAGVLNIVNAPKPFKEYFNNRGKYRE